MLQIYIKFSLQPVATVYHESQNQNVPIYHFIKQQKFDTADNKCVTVYHCPAGCKMTKDLIELSPILSDLIQFIL